MDFMTIPTLYFKVLYILVIVSHERREIKHFAVTKHPTSAWVTQQLKEATPFGMQPEYLIHDNDNVFVSNDLQEFLTNSNIRSVRTGYHSPWQNGICERTAGILRRELLDHIIPFNEGHLQRILDEHLLLKNLLNMEFINLSQRLFRYYFLKKNEPDCLSDSFFTRIL